jgi:hypothetical protein
MDIVNVLDLPQGQDFFLRQDNKSDLYLYTVKDGVAKLFKSTNTMGKWDTVDYQSVEFNTFEKDLTGLRGNEIGDTSVLVYRHGESMSILKMPQTNESYEYDNVYRLFWAVDTRILYMNICDNWEMIGTLRHDLLDNVGKLTHDELEAKIKDIEDKYAELEQEISTISTAIKTVNGLIGDITIEAGSNVLVSTDADTKKIRISSSGGGGGASQLDVVTALPTDVLDGYTCLLVTPGSVFQAVRYNNNWYQTPLSMLDSNKIILPDVFNTWVSTGSGVGVVSATSNNGYIMAYKLPGNHVASASVTTTGTIVGNKPGQAKFYIGSDSEAKYDFCHIILNGTEIGSVSGSNQVAIVYGNIVVGNNTVVLKYTKDGSGDTGNDCAYLYAIDMPWQY